MALPALLSTDDLVKFRTRFCERFLQFGECNFGGKCQYSHNMTWRRRSPQKYLYEPRLCDNILSFVGDNGAKRQSVVNCHNGKNCKFAHSREEILYHPLVYKTVLCEDMCCSKYYCPFGHAIEELVRTNEPAEYIRRCLTDAMGLDESDSDLLLEEEEGVFCDGNDLRMRKPSPSSYYRLNLPVPGSPDWNLPSLAADHQSSSCTSAWVSINASIRIETVVRATSAVSGSELCRGLISRADTAGLAAKKISQNISQSQQQFCLCKVMQLQQDKGAPACAQLIAELTSIAKTDHKNIVAIRRLHVGAIGQQMMVCVAMEQCSTSLYQAVVDGYRDNSCRGLAKKLNPHNGTTTLSAIQRIGDMISGLQRLHFTGIAHLRVHPTNVLIDSEASFKIGDFLGKLPLLNSLLIRGEEISAENPAPAACLTWQAPELILFLKKKKKLDDPPSLLKACDIYSLGLVIFFALTGQHAFGSFASPERLAASGLVTSGPLFTSPTQEVLDNMLSDYVSNQHLLYDCPLVLDLVLRCLALEPADRMEISDLSRHPLFWDLDYIGSFFASLPFGDPFFDAFTDYQLCWKQHLLFILASMEEHSVAALIDDYSETVSGLVQCLATLLPEARIIWLQMLDSFPQLLVRVWDACKLARVGKPIHKNLLIRNHLHWMSLRASAVTCVSHQFVREYYTLLSCALKGQESTEDECSAADESVGLREACDGLVTALRLKDMGRKKSKSPPLVVVQHHHQQQQQPVSGMTFVDPLIVKQMAAASAALSAVYDNPQLVTAITKGEVNAVNQLVATATIYNSLLQNAGGGAAASSF